MAFYAAAFGLLLHIVLWGCGLSLLIVPRRWKRFWLLFSPACGIALQSAVVWFGSYAGLAGTKVYARVSLLLPLALLCIAVTKVVRGRWGGRGFWSTTPRLWALALSMGIVLGTLIYPFALSSEKAALTTSSLGSCDAADYAGGARVLEEFSRHDRGGFIGHTEVVRVHSVDNFFDYWIRLNHFTPSAIIALNDAVFGREPHEMIGVVTAAFLVLGMPPVFWLVRSGLRYGPVSSLLIATLYGFSPLLWYAVYHVAMSQLLAAPAIALLTWCGIKLWPAATNRWEWQWFALLAVAYWIILGSYNFIVVLCLVPVLMYTSGLALWRREPARWLRWCGLIVGPLIAVGLVFTQRILGLVERFQLFDQHDFGWRVPGLSPEGWFGLVGAVDLSPLASVLRWPLGTVLGAGIVVGWIWLGRTAKRQAWLVLCLAVPILVGYGLLLLRGQMRQTNASYDAYKLFAVFYPGLLAAFCVGLQRASKAGRLWSTAGLAAAAALVAANVFVGQRFVKRMKSPPLMVEPALVKLKQLETRPEITSLNLLIDDAWSRLWANAFLLRKPQFFAAHTYEGRLNTRLAGAYNLYGDVLQVAGPDEVRADGRTLVSPPYSLFHADPNNVRVQLGGGWYGVERTPRKGLIWRWTSGNASISIVDPMKRPLVVTLRARVRSPGPRKLEVWLGGRRVVSTDTAVDFRDIEIPPTPLVGGEHVIEFRTDSPVLPPGGGDTRPLAFAFYKLELTLSLDGLPAP